MISETAAETVKNITAGWNLGNTFDSHGEPENGYSVTGHETLWGSPVITREMIKTVSAAGFNAVRLPVTWDAHSDSEGNIRGEWLDRVEQVAGYITDEGMYCIIDMHHDGGPSGWLCAEEDSFQRNSRRFTGIWRNIAERFRDAGRLILFEGFNEVLDSHTSWTEPAENISYDVINRYNRLFVDTVRETGGNNVTRNLVLQTYSGGETERTLNGFLLPRDSSDGHLIAAVHNYDPQGFCWLSAKDQVMRGHWGTDGDKAQLDGLIDRLAAFGDRTGVPVIIGEYGSQDKGNEVSRAAHAGYLVRKAAAAGIKCFWWDTPEEFGIIDRENCRVKFPEVVKAVCDHTV